MDRSSRFRLTEMLIIAAVCGAACQPEPAREIPQLPYDSEFPGIPYGAVDPAGRLGQFAGRFGNEPDALGFDANRGYLDATLAALDIDAASQVLVFSRTSLQTGHIRPATPRAIYFNDDSYVAWTPGAPALELSGMDPELGPVFFSLKQDRSTGPEREFRSCLRCHDTYSLSGGGVPRFLIGSGYTGTDGQLVSHEAWILTDQATALRSRWGGWYVTGQASAQAHLGNIVVQNVESLQTLDAIRVGTVDRLDDFFDTSNYLTPYSDVAALLVLEHQLEVQNLISRVRFESLGKGATTIDARLDRYIDDLARALFLLDEAGLDAPNNGNSGFAAQFEQRGPFDSSGRSLRQLDLTTRVFRYPLSYLIYSDALQSLPGDIKAAVYSRVRDGLQSTPDGAGATRVSVADRQAALAILAATLPEFAAE